MTVVSQGYIQWENVQKFSVELGGRLWENVRQTQSAKFVYIWDGAKKKTIKNGKESEHEEKLF